LFAKLLSADPNEDIAAALDRFYRFCAACTVPEVIRLARTVETWQDPIIAALQTGLTNARSEATTASSNTSDVLRSDSATLTTNAAAYGGPAPANHGESHPAGTNATANCEAAKPG
jgi:hypothetical protein